MTSLAPILVFVYNRPKHTLQTLEALSQNDLANQSDLFIFCDGARENASAKELHQIKELNKVLHSKQWCKTVKIIQRPTNFGTAKNIVFGITEIIKAYGKAIIVEDDIVTSKGFLKYMNDALEIYATEDKVMHINAYLAPIDDNKITEETLFYNQANPWGWATWKRAWDLLSMDKLYLLRNLKDINYFNIDGSFPVYDMLKEIPNNWDVRWSASIHIHNGFVLNPKRTMVKNIGFDGSGVHFNGDAVESVEQNEQLAYVEVKKLPIVENVEVRQIIQTYYKQRIPSKSIVSKVKWTILDFLRIRVLGRRYYPLELKYQLLSNKENL